MSASESNSIHLQPGRCCRCGAILGIAEYAFTGTRSWLEKLHDNCIFASD
ncbi:MAG: hypothetical protein OFPI_13560 [Osedax symbiont Rs2]|nr:MAG: hypothetical protein OFPI_13560 [Osedax symbiont Rs2]